jgi:protoheme IX farnesyltransferase
MISGQAAAETTPVSLWHEIVVLFKLRIVVLLLFAALGGTFLAANGWPGWRTLALVLITGGMAAAGASALNEYIERDRDALMNRTRKRPLVTGSFGPRVGWVLGIALAMILLPVLAVLPFNPALSAALAGGAFIYVVIYTLWLKPRTALNIVIGGAAGSCAVLSGSAAAGNWASPGALALALLVFLWTPIHFWALALVYRDDYARAHVPMLPVQTAPRTAAAWGLVHGIGAGVMALAIAAMTPSLGLVYGVPAALASLALIYQGARLVHAPVRRVAWRLFHTSNLFLFAILLAICLDAIIHVPWPL